MRVPMKMFNIPPAYFKMKKHVNNASCEHIYLTKKFKFLVLAVLREIWKGKNSSSIS